jgi:hypothetical protein
VWLEELGHMKNPTNSSGIERFERKQTRNLVKGIRYPLTASSGRFQHTETLVFLVMDYNLLYWSVITGWSAIIQGLSWYLPWESSE